MVKVSKGHNILSSMALKLFIVLGVAVAFILVCTPMYFNGKLNTIENDITKLITKDTEEISVGIGGLTLDRCQNFKGCIELNDNKKEPTIIVMDSNEMNWLNHTKELILIIPKLTKSEKVMLEDAGLRHVIAKSITVKKQQ